MMGVLNGQELEIPADYAGHLLYDFGVYTSFSVVDGKVLEFDAHMDRLRGNAEEFLGVAPSRPEVIASIKSFLDGMPRPWNVTVRVTVFPRDFSLATPHKVSGASVLVTGRQGSSVAGKPLTLKVVACDRPYAQYKITNIAAAMKVRAIAKSESFDDGLMHAAGFVTEGTTWNVFFIRKGKLVTPPTDGRILPGTTRQIVVNKLNLDILEEPVSVSDIPSYEAAFATNAAMGAGPIERIDGTSFDVSHPLIATIKEQYASLPRSEIVFE